MIKIIAIYAIAFMMIQLYIYIYIYHVGNLILDYKRFIKHCLLNNYILDADSKNIVLKMK